MSMDTVDHLSADRHTPDGSSSELTLAGMLEAASAEPLRQALLERIAAGGPLSLDASNIDRISTAAAQVLVSALRTADAHGIAARIVAPCPEFLAALDDLGLLSDVLKRVTSNG